MYTGVNETMAGLRERRQKRLHGLEYVPFAWFVFSSSIRAYRNRAATFSRFYLRLLWILGFMWIPIVTFGLVGLERSIGDV